MKSPFETTMNYLFREGLRHGKQLLREEYLREYPPPMRPRRRAAQAKTHEPPPEPPTPPPSRQPDAVPMTRQATRDHWLSKVGVSAKVVGGSPYPHQEPLCGRRGPRGEFCILPLCHDPRLCHRDQDGVEWSGGAR